VIKPTISIVIPCFNEEGNVANTYRELNLIIDSESQYNFEFIFTDNHSTDNTFKELNALADKDSRIKIYRFSKNFGYQKSIYTGYMKSSGSAAIQIDADLQDPPTLIPSFLRHWEQGFKVVYGIRKTRKSNFLLTFMTQLFYRLLDNLSEAPLPRNAGECRLLDRVIIEELSKIKDNDIYIRGRIAELGFDQKGIEYERRDRQAGQTKFTFINLIRLSADAITGHSIIPLRLASYLGLLMLTFSTIGTIGFIFSKVFFGHDWPAGFTTIIILILTLNGLNSLLIGILGEYIGRIHQQLKNNPEAIIEEER